MRFPRFRSFLPAAMVLCTMACASLGARAPLKTIFVNVTPSDRICAKKDGTVPLSIFITLIGMPDLPVTSKIDEGFLDVTLYGINTTIELQKVGIGEHHIDVFAGDVHVNKYFSVWVCKDI